MKTIPYIVITVLLLDAAPVLALEVTRFGAVPNDGQDDTAAFLAAFKEAQAKGEKRIFPRGAMNCGPTAIPTAGMCYSPWRAWTAW
jgi:hypothetical protein